MQPEIGAKSYEYKSYGRLRSYSFFSGPSSSYRLCWPLLTGYNDEKNRRVDRSPATTCGSRCWTNALPRYFHSATNDLPPDMRPFLTHSPRAAVVIHACVTLVMICACVGRGEESVPGRVDLARQVRAILSNNCYQCHGPDDAQRQAGLRLDTLAGASAELASGSRAIVAGDSAESVLIDRVSSDDTELRMPPSHTGKKLTVDEIQLLARWIDQGASFVGHWAYQPPARTIPPHVGDAGWAANGVDRFVLARLERAQRQPSSAADRHALIRRVTLDLTGLSPTWRRVEHFLGDNHPAAWERLIDRLLAKPTFGEHWARQWLDLARYADSAGYADDPARTIWGYRDWVIRAINQNLPFDQFTIEQLAGDLLSQPTQDQLVATAFHRNTLTNNEGGTNDEEYRNVAIVDRVNTTMAVWMGTTMACAQCHNHKFDPISQEEYFRLFAILNNTEDADRRDESPVLEIWTAEQQQQKAEWAGASCGTGSAVGTSAAVGCGFSDRMGKATSRGTRLGHDRAGRSAGAIRGGDDIVGRRISAGDRGQ